MWAQIHLLLFSGVSSASGSSGSALTFSYSPVTTATVGAAYTGATPSTSGGNTPYTYSMHAGTLPHLLSLNSSTGIITGTPDTVETQTGLVLRVTDALFVFRDSSSFTITVSAGGAHTPPNLLLRDGSSFFLQRNGSDRITLRVGVFVLLLHNGIDHLLLGHN